MTPKEIVERLEGYESLVNTFARQIALKMKPSLIGTGEIDPRLSLNIQGVTIEDIKQELRIEIFLALNKYDPEKATTELGTKTELSWIWKFLEDRTKGLMRTMWGPSKGQKFRHSTGLQSEALFNGEALSEAMEELRGNK